MKTHILYAIIALAVISSCKAQENRDEVIDPVTPSPYRVHRESPYVNLPDSLGFGKYNGYAFIEGEIDTSLAISNVKIMKFKLESNNGDIYIDYYYGMESDKTAIYEKRMVEYIPFFEQYFNTLKIERVDGTNLNRMNKITLPLKFE